jgi:hypothetical protein
MVSRRRTLAPTGIYPGAVAFAVRRLGAGDEHVLALLAEQAPEFDLAGRTSPERPLSPSDAAAYLADPGVLHWVADEDGRIIGELLCHVLRMPSRHACERCSTPSASVRATADAVSARRSWRRCSGG